MKIYLAEFRYGRPNLASAEVVKETPKMYQIKRDSIKRLTGSVYFGRRVRKDCTSLFHTHTDAVTWLADRAREHVDACMKKYNEAVATSEEMDQLLAEFHD